MTEPLARPMSPPWPGPWVSIVDLSMPIEDNPYDPSVQRVRRWTHERGPARMGRKAAWSRRLPWPARLSRGWRYLTGGRRIGRHCFPDGTFLGNEFYTVSAHAGTHLDAPYHYGARSEGRPAARIDEVPLEWCCGPGVLLRLTHKLPNELITPDDLDRELDRIGHCPQPGEIVLIETGSDRLWPGPRYFTAHPGMSRAATAHLVEQGIRVIGIDTAGFDLPAATMIARYYATGDPNHLWPSHLYGRERPYLQVERMGNLRALPRQTGFTVLCLPIRLTGAGAGWVRAVALLPATESTMRQPGPHQSPAGRQPCEYCS